MLEEVYEELQPLINQVEPTRASWLTAAEYVNNNPRENDREPVHLDEDNSSSDQVSPTNSPVINNYV